MSAPGMAEPQLGPAHRRWYSRGYLPHCDHPGLLQAITYRLADSLSTAVLEQMDAQLRHRPPERQDPERRKRIKAWLDADDHDNNEFPAVNQCTVVDERRERWPDVVLFIHGLPLAVIELKNPADENADIWRAFNQLQTYKQQIPSLFVHNATLLVSDAVQARIGTLTADREWFLPWRTITGEELAAPF